MNLESVHPIPTVNALQITKDAQQDATDPLGGWTISRRGSEGQIEYCQPMWPLIIIQSSHQEVTIRKPIDCLIATFCLLHSHHLLHNDRDYDPFEEWLGLRVIHP